MDDWMDGIRRLGREPTHSEPFEAPSFPARLYPYSRVTQRGRRMLIRKKVEIRRVGYDQKPP
jgi:hypothetical protein